MKPLHHSFVFTAAALFFSGIFISTESFADHGPEKMWKRNIKPYFTAHETGTIGPFKINIESFGKEQSHKVKQIKQQNFDKFFDKTSKRYRTFLNSEVADKLIYVVIFREIDRFK